MPYDHANKIGNQGDVVKHAVLAHLIGNVGAGKRFVYAETNAGRPLCELPHRGEWQAGVGIFSRCDLVVADREAMGRGEPARFPTLSRYDQLCVGREIGAGDSYPGSSVVAFRALDGCDRSFRLWETHTDTFQHLQEHFRDASAVRVSDHDGYQGVSDLLDKETPSLVLIDPPDTKANRKIARLIVRLCEKKAPFLCWTPTGGAAPQAKGQPARPPKPHFEDLLKGGKCSAFFVTWTNGWGPRACQLTVSADLGRHARDAAQAVCTVMRTPNAPWALHEPDDP